jgi:hypothetical protein
MLISITKPGLMDASAIPRKNLFVARPANELHPAVVMTMTPWTISGQSGFSWNRLKRSDFE